jgi:archaellum component FlaC
MKRLRPVFLAGVSLLLLQSGCSNKGPDPAFTKLQEQSTEQLVALKKHHEILNKKLNRINERVGKLQKSHEKFSQDLATYVARPDTMTMLIVTEVNKRFSSVLENQVSFVDTVSSAVKKRMSEMEGKATVQLDEFKKQVDEHDQFVHFVTAQQDSINRVFAVRLDSRPWYESILGKWDDLQRAREAGSSPGGDHGEE